MAWQRIGNPIDTAVPSHPKANCVLTVGDHIYIQVGHHDRIHAPIEAEGVAKMSKTISGPTGCAGHRSMHPIIAYIVGVAKHRGDYATKPLVIQF